MRSASSAGQWCTVRGGASCNALGIGRGGCAKADERHALHDILTSTPHLTDLLAAGPRTIIADKNYYGRDFERELSDADITVLRPARKGETRCVAEQFFKPLRQIIESINDTLKRQLDLEHHDGRTVAGVRTRIAQRILALTAAIWHNDTIGATIKRSHTPTTTNLPAIGKTCPQDPRE